MKAGRAHARKTPKHQQNRGFSPARRAALTRSGAFATIRRDKNDQSRQTPRRFGSKFSATSF